jgi:pyrimidine-nucleoside phosphorylase
MPSFLQSIESKRDGHALSDDAMHAFVDGVVTEARDLRLPDYQISAFLMAVFFRGLDDRERRTLTLAMRDSGETLTFPANPKRPVVDKHSTGGVGDKVSLPLAPLLACLGFRVPMISGRGLGITGGTLDKLESIPGFTTRLSRERILHQVETLGVAMAGQTDHMVPADRRLYALCDVTGTVPSRDLITASILSKKLAQGLDCLVLDVKFGSGAFMRDYEQARQLARNLVDLANDCGVHTRALLTSMDSPLGRAAGNWLEIRETVACLSGSGPSDLRELVLACAAHLLVQTGRQPDLPDATEAAATCLDSGAPLARWNDLLAAQGADLARYASMLCADTLAPAIGVVRAPRSGFVSRADSRILGEVIRDLGGGRLQQDSIIDPHVGIDQLAKPGEPIRAGEPLCRIHARTAPALEHAITTASAAFQINESPEPGSPLIREVILPPNPPRARAEE